MNTLYLECAMGAAGDMLMGALYELLDDKASFLETMNHLIPGVEVRAERGVTAGICGTHMRVLVHGEEEGREHTHEHDQGHVHEHAHEHEHIHEHVHGPENPFGDQSVPVHIHVHGSESEQPRWPVVEHEHAHDHAHGHAHHHHAAPGQIAALIGSLPLPEEVRVRARRVYDAIAAAEAKAHGVPVEEVHFHEVGALDAVADVAGVCYAVYLLHPDRIAASPVHVGSGTVRCAHGVMPVPAPATAALLQGVPVYGGAVQGELCTPTGAALLRELAESFGPMPPMALHAAGIGVGTKQFEQANCVRALWGESADQPQGSEANGEICELVCNIDDMTAEALAFAAEQLLECGALDVYTQPGTMKKGRPGHVLTVLCAPEREAEFARLLFLHTSTNGLRARRCAKYYLAPGAETAETPWGPVRVKTAEGFGVKHVKPEYEDAARLARERQLPLETIYKSITYPDRSCPSD